MRDLDLLEEIDNYRRLFISVPFWEPYVKEICRRHNLTPDAPLRTGIPGTCPTFIVGERWVVKLFGRLFNGERSFQVEREAGRLVALDPLIRAALPLSEGDLGGPGWRWPYLIYPFLPGASLGELSAQVSAEDWRYIAQEMGGMVRRLHALPLKGSSVFPSNLDAYYHFLEKQRAACVVNHRAWGSLPTHLVDQIEGYLPPLEDLVDLSRPAHIIHADLTCDHLLGHIKNGHWNTVGLIDFGDAMTGDLLYELAALQLDMFHADPCLLDVFLKAYGLPPEQRSGLARKAMAMALLHEFDLFCLLSSELLRVETLGEIEKAVWAC